MMALSRFLRVVSPSLFIVMGFACAVVGQTETATVSGLVTDRTGATVPGAEVRLQSVDRGTVTTTTTNDAGIYIFPSVHPGQFQISVHKQGFKQVDLLGLIVNVQDHIEQNFHLEIGSVAESVTVEAGALLINTTDATVSTLVDRQFAENLPMNGRSFQTLIQLTPGVVVTASNPVESGQFSVNGQRPSSNYWMVDGVSANVGIGTSVVTGNGLSGASPGFSLLGGTNSLVSVDALQEFRIQTSTFAPEFGRTPGGQIAILTRSGASQFHGTAFDYFRNDVLDANNWFNTSVTPSIPKAKERQNDFGGTFSGPILKDRTFFFFSYEGLRLRLPQTALTNVPDIAARQNAIPAMQPYLNAFPLPNGMDNLPAGIAQLNASYSNPATLDAYSIRVDHKLGRNLTLFGRYSYSPSTAVQRDPTDLGNVAHSQATLQTATVGITWTFSSATVNDLRFNYSRTESKSRMSMDTFGGAVPLGSLPFPGGFNLGNSVFQSLWLDLGADGPFAGASINNHQRQINVVDNVTVQKGGHSLKLGIDFRRLSPVFGVPVYEQDPIFFDVPSSESASLGFAEILSGREGALLFHNLGVFGQDTWRAAPRLTVTYGLRWDVDFAPSSTPAALLAVTGFNLNNLSNLALAPAGTPPFQTTYGNVAPRIGIAYQLAGGQSRQAVLRGGFGVFYDLATSEMGNLANYSSYPFGAVNFLLGQAVGGTSTFPLSSADAAPPAIIPPNANPANPLYAIDPHTKLPYTLEWNVALEQALGSQQSFSVSYLGSSGRRLLQELNDHSPSANFGSAILITNAATSDYNALQLQFQRRLSRGLQALASYTWSHSIDTASSGGAGNFSDLIQLGAPLNQNRGPSDFDIRHAFSAGVTYNVPSQKLNTFTNAILRGWSVDNVIQARSALPVTVTDGAIASIKTNEVVIRPDVVPGIPLYLNGSQYPGGKILNNTPNEGGPGCFGPFCPPPAGEQGNLGRNALRGFGAWQWDFAVHRDFPLGESVKLQFRAEMFNVLNHPNFAPPISDITNSQFGQSTQTLGNYLAMGSVGSGALSPLYQVGGPRSIQFALKLFF